MRQWTGADGNVIAGDEWGDPAGSPVILLHGGGQTRHAWKGTGERLAAQGYHVVAPDARGHGDSDWAPDGDYEQDAFVRDLRALVEALGNRPPVLIGASLGGTTSLAAIGEGTIRASALVLVDIAAATAPEGAERIKQFMGQRPNGFDSLEEVADAIAQYRPGIERPRNLRGLAKNVRIGADGRYRWHWDPLFLAARTRDLEIRHGRLAPAARRLRVPTLLVRGGSSDVVSEEAVREFRELCPHAEFVNIADAGHMVAGDDNDLFGRETVAFLRRHVPPRGAS